MKKLFYSLILSIFSMVFSSALFALPFQNGSFEIGPNPGVFSTLSDSNTAILGWEVTQGSIDYIGTYWVASDGGRSIDLNGNYAQGGISQTFDTILGETYHVSFDLAGNYDSGVDPKTLNVSVALYSGGYSFFKPISWNHTSMGWITYDFVFAAQANSSILTFTSTTGATNDAFGPALDNVHVDQVPEPASLLFLGAGLFGLGFLGRRKK